MYSSGQSEHGLVECPAHQAIVATQSTFHLMSNTLPPTHSQEGPGSPPPAAALPGLWVLFT